MNTENRKLGGKGKSHVPPARYHELTYLLAVFPNDVALYADEAAEFWFKYEPILAEVLDGDHGVCTGLKLRRLLNASRGAMGHERLYFAILTLVPHSMQTDRIVSHYNTLLAIQNRA